jgi:HTH-type transcriptional regulator, sugar sensing transcriptional regulator
MAIKENDLQILGLNKYEAEVYKSLVRLGKSSSVQISQDSDVPYGRVYDILNSLVNKKLVKIIPEKSKKFAPADPRILDELLKKKFEELQGIKQKVEKLKEDYSQKDEETVWVVKGKRNFYRAIGSLPEDKNQLAIRYTAELNPKWIRNMKKINSKNLVRVDSETIDNISAWKKHHPKLELRKIKNTGVAIDIRDNYCWVALIKSNTLLVIKDKAFIDLMKTLFLNTYKNAPKI